MVVKNKLKASKHRHINRERHIHHSTWWCTMRSRRMFTSSKSCHICYSYLWCANLWYSNLWCNLWCSNQWTHNIYCVALYSVLIYGVVNHGVMIYGVVIYGVVIYGVVIYGTAIYGTVIYLSLVSFGPSMLRTLTLTATVYCYYNFITCDLRCTVHVN